METGSVYFGGRRRLDWKYQRKGLSFLTPFALEGAQFPAARRKNSVSHQAQQPLWTMMVIRWQDQRRRMTTSRLILLLPTIFLRCRSCSQFLALSALPTLTA